MMDGIEQLRTENAKMRSALIAVQGFFALNKDIADRFSDLANLVEQATESDHPEVIYAYTRKQALEDGELADVSTIAREAGLKFPTALTKMLFAELTPSKEEEARGQSFSGRLWDLFTMFKFAVRNGNTSNVVEFTFLVARADKTVEVRVKGICGPGDDARPVLTFMLPDED